MISDSPPIEKVTTLNSNIARELIWRRNAPYFYQLLYCNALEWPSLAVEWWVDKHDNTSKATMDDETLCYLTYGTHTADDEPNYLVFAKLYIPNQDYLRKIGRDKVNRPCDTVKCN